MVLCQENKEKKIFIVGLLIVLGLFGLITIKYINEKSGNNWGEADSYMLPAISIIKHGSMIINDNDIELSKEYYPEFYNAFKAKYDAGWYKETINGGKNPYYFCTYSIICIPLVLLLHAMGISAIWAFPYTNMILIVATAIFVALNFDELFKKILTLVCVLFSPAILYISWQSAEVLIYCLVCIAIVCFIKGQYKLAALACSLAGTLNITIMFFGFVIIFEYTREKIMENKGFFKAIRNNIKDILLLILCFSIVFVPIVHNIIFVKSANDTFSMATFSGYGQRILSYLFDLNLGMFSVYPLFGMVLLIMLLFNFKIGEVKFFELVVAGFGVVMSFSLALHINCGMIGISRYGAWTTPFIFLTMIKYDSIIPISIKIRKIIWVVMVISTELLIAISSCTGANELSYEARFVLDYFPTLYNPMYSTFTYRTLHDDVTAGYNYSTRVPIVYRDSKGFVRKVLTDNAGMHVLMDAISCNDEAYKYMDEQVNKHDDEEIYYVNIPIKYEITSTLIPNMPANGKSENICTKQLNMLCVRSGEVYSIPLTIEENVYYEIEIIYRQPEMKRADNVVVDIYGGETYDSAEQQGRVCVLRYTRENGYDTKIAFNSGNSDAAIDATQIRIFNSNDCDIYIYNISIDKIVQ